MMVSSHYKAQEAVFQYQQRMVGAAAGWMHSLAESRSGQGKIVTLSPDSLLAKLLLEGATHLGMALEEVPS